MTDAEAIALIQGAIHNRGGMWADLGAGTGAFTNALAAVLGPNGAVQAIERDASAVASLRALRRARPSHATIDVTLADFTQPIELGKLDGILMANSLHFVSYGEHANLLKRLAKNLNPTGRIVVVEYDRDDGNAWVPYPVSLNALVSLAASAALSEPVVIGRTRSRFGGEMYCAWVSAAVLERSPPCAPQH